MNKQHGLGSTDKMLREYLEALLLSDKELQLLEDELFIISPELIVCKNCEQNMPAHRVPVLAHTYEVVNGIRKDITLKLAALFHDIGKPYTKRTINGVDSFKGHERVSELLAVLMISHKKLVQNWCCLYWNYSYLIYWLILSKKLMNLFLLEKIP